MRKTVAQGYGFCLKLGYPKNHVVYHQYPHQNFPFGGIGIFIPSDHIDAAYNIAYDVLDIILYTYQNNQTIADHITSHHLILYILSHFIAYYLISSYIPFSL